MYQSFFLFQTPLDLAHAYWSQLVQPGDIVVDATCGKGKDTLILCQLALSSPQGCVYGLDIQSQALIATQHYLAHHHFLMGHPQIIVEQRCHSLFPDSIKPQTVKLIVYNLGYLPGADKSQTTQVETTLASLTKAQELLMPGGAISITCYPGHAEGAREQEALLKIVSQWPSRQWSCCHHQWLNRQHSPSLLLLQKSRLTE